MGILLVFLLAGATLAAQPYYGWRLGAGVGGAAYYGDLSYRLDATKVSGPAWQVLLGRSLGPSLDVELNASWGRFSASDQATDWRGNLRTDNPNLDRGLNFETRYRTAALLIQYKLDNGYLLSQYARFGPYLFAGGGITDFAVYGDLQNSGSFDTKLSSRERGASYPTSVLTVPVGAGLRWRISERLSADIRAGASYAFSDYLDNVEAGKGRDVYFTGGVSLQYHFELGGDKFRAPLVYVGSDAPPAATVAASPAPAVPDAIRRIDSSPAPALPPSSTATNLPDDFVRGQGRVQPVQPATAPDASIPAGRVTRAAPWDTLSTRNRPGGADAATRENSAALQPVPKPAPGPAYRTDTSSIAAEGVVAEEIAAEETDADEAVAGNKSPDAGRQPLQRADGPRRPERSANGSAANGNTRPEAAPVGAVPGASEARVQRLEAQVAELNRQLETLRNERLVASERLQTNERLLANERLLTNERLQANERQAAGRLSQNNDPNAGQVGNDGNDRNRPVRETRERETRQYVVVPGRRDRNLDRGQAAGELSAITAQLNTLKAGQNQLMADQSSQRKLDSLLTQVTALRSQLDTVRAARPTGPAPGSIVAADSTAAGNNDPRRDTLGRTQSPEPGAAAAGDTVLHAVQDQLAALRRSVEQLQGQLVAANAAPTPRKRLPYGPLVIYYPVNSVAISPADKERLAVTASRLERDPSAVVQVKGFADQTGNAAYNLALSRKRAEQIRNYLVTSLGVAPERVIVNYFGQAQATDAGQNPHDRRVELELYSTEK